MPANKSFTKLTARDLAFGIGRKATDQELDEMLSRPQGKGKDGRQMLKEIKHHLHARTEKRKVS